MTKPIGRLWNNGGCVSGYIILGTTCIKFAASTDNGSPAWIFPAKEKEESEEQQ